MNKNDKLINTLFLISLGVIFLALVLVVLISIFQPFGPKKISQLPKTTISTCLTKEKDGEYFCVLYDPNDLDNANIEKVMIEYNKAKKENNSLKSLYVIDYTKEDPEAVTKLLEKVTSVDNMPYMFVVSKGSIKSTKYDTSSKICNALVEELAK